MAMVSTYSADKHYKEGKIFSTRKDMSKLEELYKNQ